MYIIIHVERERERGTLERPRNSEKPTTERRRRRHLASVWRGRGRGAVLQRDCELERTEGAKKGGNSQKRV